jgi:multiple sugar transport system permease protein
MIKASIKKKRIRPKIFSHILIIAGALVMIYPLLWMIAASLKPQDEIFTNMGLIPQQPTFNNYITGWNATAYPFIQPLINSTIVCAGAVAGNLISCTLAAYAFSRLQFPLRGSFFAIMLGSIMLPHNALIIPQYILFMNLDWLNSFLPLIVPKFFATDAFFVFLLVQFFRTIPTEFDEAAKMDGANHWQIFTRVMLPLAVPALASTAIFTFLFTWNDFFSQLIFLTKQSLWTTPLALRSFLDSTGTSNFGGLFAMSLISLIPILGFFIAFQRLLIEGVAASGLKG